MWKIWRICNNSSRELDWWLMLSLSPRFRRFNFVSQYDVKHDWFLTIWNILVQCYSRSQDISLFPSLQRIIKTSEPSRCIISDLTLGGRLWSNWRKTLEAQKRLTTTTQLTWTHKFSPTEIYIFCVKKILKFAFCYVLFLFPCETSLYFRCLSVSYLDYVLII